MRVWAGVAAAVCLFAAGIGAAQDVVGVAKRVRGAAELLAAQGRDKLLAPGDRIRQNDIVKTGVNGSALLQLADATVFTVGANAEIKIDRFVYDPAQATQSFAQATILQGALRFISGQIAKENPGGLQIATPVGTIGVRGTIAAVEAGNGATTIILLDPQNAPPGGALVIQTAAGEARLSQPGEGLILREG
ncbi:MAG: FecR domain-containing protein, partial [Pseudomonadota bacterium]